MTYSALIKYMASLLHLNLTMWKYPIISVQKLEVKSIIIPVVFSLKNMIRVFLRYPNQKYLLDRLDRDIYCSLSNEKGHKT